VQRTPDKSKSAIGRERIKLRNREFDLRGPEVGIRDFDPDDDFAAIFTLLNPFR